MIKPVFVSNKPKMKLFLVLCALAAVTLADNTDFDWSTVRPVHEIPEFLETHKAIANLIKEHGAPKRPDSFILGGELAIPGQFPYAVRFSVS